LENLLGLLPIIVLILIQIVVAGKKREKAREAQNQDSVLAVEGRKPAGVEPEDAGEDVPHWLVKKAPKPVPVPRKPSPAVLGSPPVPLAGIDKAPVPGETRDQRTGGFWGTLEKLPPLKRAVILADILGPPKGISTGPGDLP
jgi:hypothetical protein